MTDTVTVRLYLHASTANAWLVSLDGIVAPGCWVPRAELAWEGGVAPARGRQGEATLPRARAIEKNLIAVAAPGQGVLL